MAEWGASGFGLGGRIPAYRLTLGQMMNPVCSTADGAADAAPSDVNGAKPVPTFSKVVVLSDGRAGNYNQSLGVAAALGVEQPELVTFPMRSRFAAWLPVSWIYSEKLLARIMDADLVLATGWRVSRVSRWLRRRRAVSGRPVFTVQMLRPSGRADEYDVVALPWHDARKRANRKWMQDRANVIVTDGSANLISPARLAREAERWQARLGSLPTPRLAVVIGGASRHGDLAQGSIARLLDSVIAWAARSGGSLLVTTSRRTGKELNALVAARLGGVRGIPVHFWLFDDAARSDNPYLAYLALADALVVTDDSISMVNDGMSAGKPVYLYGDESGLPAKFRAFFEHMEGRVTRWNGILSLPAPADALAAAAKIAAFVRARLAMGGHN